ncbi:hypothetical protein [Saccharopolyspora hattusasensis]|uniref:hypothetical protein n=1 Tax=Saccharopolyspora hattusasensis TaxID=1128679 RepID=UPI003D97BB7B
MSAGSSTIPIDRRCQDLILLSLRPLDPAIGRALVLRDPSRVRNRAFDLIGLARTHLITSEPDRACELIDSALPIAGHWASGRVGEKLRNFHRESKSFATSPTVRSTRDAIRDLFSV